MTEQTSLLQQIDQLVDSGSLALPVFNAAATKLLALNTADLDAAKVEDIILADQVLSAEVLRAANSSFFGGLTQVQTIRGAIVRVGLLQVVHLAVLASNRTQYEARDSELRETVQRLWLHAAGTAKAASWLARRLRFGKQIETEAFLGGLLHDVGKLVILRAIDELKAAGKNPEGLSGSVTGEVVETAHTSLGFKFLKQWDIPDVYCEIARDHHQRDFAASSIPSVIVRLANQAAAKTGVSLRSSPSLVLSTLPEAQCLNANTIVLAELEIMLEDSAPQLTKA